MEVAIVSSTEPVITKPGGTRSYVLNLIKRLRDKGLKVTLYGVSYDSTRKHHYNGFEFIPIADGKDISSERYLRNLFLRVPLLEMPSDIIIHAQRPDILFPFTLYKKKNPKICTIHGIPNLGIYRRKGIARGVTYDFLERMSLKDANKIIFVDTKTEEWYLKKYDWLKGRSHVVPVGIDLNIFKPLDKNTLRKEFGFAQNDKIILYIGRLEVEKRVHLLIESFNNLIEEVDAKLVIVGSGPEKNKLVAFGKNPNIKFIGTLPHEEIPKILSCADVLVLCSEYEGMPTVVLEALACGIPVVSTDVGDVRMIVVDGKTGFITKDNAEDIKNKLSRILSISSKFKYNCIEKAKLYSWDVIAKDILDIYREVLNEVPEES